MPNTQPNSQPVNARRFAALFAGFDIGNMSDEEALAKALGMRRMARDANIRIVDLLELPDIRTALDDQLQPMRMENADLEEAVDQIAELNDELVERMHDVRRLADQLRHQEEETESLRLELIAVQPRRGAAKKPITPFAAAASHGNSFGSQSWIFEGAVVALVGLMIVVSLFTGRFFERSNGNGLGNSERTPAALVRKDSPVLHVPKHHPLPRRLHRGGASPGSR